ncbi:sodium-dependent transporter [Rhodococcus sp. IEGM 1408]|uniref:sodium-dependent transporter n=1 Tax=Rhodococcus sp. IEGM 1408 TaxID=3082220 RepID=UPI0029549A8F|nr:sodium-dependent transporter [Rhodococcus sp. IEGM 1408]MDV8000796.1 sodium-dependent transporter [Rhodococcus sp. IEGM 1408]
MTAPAAPGGTRRREAFSGRSVFVFAAIGSAVGLGNIWRFPFVAYDNGGGAFLVPYLVALLSAGIPLLLFDYSIGHRFRGSAPLSFRRMHRFAEPIGWIQVLVSFVIAVYYAVILAWAACYAWFSVDQRWGETYEETATFFSEDFLRAGSGFGLDFIPLITIILVAVWVITLGVLLAGVQKGIGRTALLFIPLLVVLFTALVIRSLFLEGAMDGLNTFFTPDWGVLTDPGVWIAAYGQIFLSLSVGFGIMLTYSSYLKRKSNLTSSGLVVGFSNSAFEVLAGIGVFATLGFLVSSSAGAGWDDVGGGPGLAFIAFPALISQMPGGPIWGVVFFTCLILAGLTSMISIVEVVIASFQDKTGVSRTAATLGVGVPMAAVSILLMPTETGLQNLDILDKFANSIGIVGIALISLIVVMFAMRLGPTLRDHLNSVSSFKVGRIWIVCMAVVTPLVLAYALFGEVRTLISEPYEGYDSAVLGVYGWGMIAGIVVLSVILSLLPWRGAKRLDGPPEFDDDPSDFTYDEQLAHRRASAPNPDTRKEV